MKKSILLFIGLAFCLCALGQDDIDWDKLKKEADEAAVKEVEPDKLAFVSGKFDGKYVYILSKPAEDYDEVFKFKSTPVKAPPEVIAYMGVMEANEKGKKLRKDFDAIILGMGVGEIEGVAIKFK